MPVLPRYASKPAYEEIRSLPECPHKISKRSVIGAKSSGVFFWHRSYSSGIGDQSDLTCLLQLLETRYAFEQTFRSLVLAWSDELIRNMSR